MLAGLRAGFTLFILIHGVMTCSSAFVEPHSGFPAVPGLTARLLDTR